MSQRNPGPDRDLYRLLGVDATVDAAALARAYRRRLRQLHPDTRAAADAAERTGDDAEQAAAYRALELAAVQQAYQVLRDPHRRDRYDAEQRSRTAVTRTDVTRTDVTRTDDAAGTAAAGVRGAPGRTVPITVRTRAAPRREQFLIRIGPVRIEPLPPQSAR